MISKDKFEQTSDIFTCLKELNVEKSNKINENDIKTFQEIICEVKNSKLYSKWNKSDILRWSQKIQSQDLQNLNKQTLVEVLCVLDRAVELDKKHQIREVQMLSLLSLLCKNENQGRILQILTGQGKTLIISCLAVLLSLQGCQVDIVTSNDVLAKRDSQELKSFYSLFNLKCSHNIQKEEKKQKKQKKAEKGSQKFVEEDEEEEEEEQEEEIKFDEENKRRDLQKDLLTQNENDDTQNMEVEEQDGTASCYQNDINIVYGTAHFFQADILKHEFYKKGNRGSRRFDQVIVDEVDSMLVDSRNHRTLLASEQSGFNKIMLIIQMIWIELGKIEDLINPKTLKK
ncbi:SecA DEAD-box-like domain protein (macronuclear) [Tetrahymena thermophila SB210]|uniref:SecA DEAD-box-like domain protein n=1 Tax=Tetrahymena thermophila (strain SB210) TaxID=312017 RepID=W7XC53_TETTS|nr:SecA DEAD-box-like domain protein [Tetrahymena thermophila SB210]EWS74967.1 SecA DEAD-box-like domain protein [Tetrahymena thermophila SB210]|eukprot:XP_012652508.1 SecA DEAD-box-like domain protein [Tetrahymena thermophila SB210]